DTTRSLRCPRTGFAEMPENPSEPPHFRPTESLESGAGRRSCLFISTSPRKVSRIAFDIREYSVPCWCSNKYKGLLNLGSRLNISSRLEEHTSELQSRENLVCRLLLEKKKKHNHRKNSYSRY